MKQKFARGCLVYIQPITDPCRKHFASDIYAIIEGTNAQLYGGDNINSYSIIRWIDGVEVAWYYEEDFELVCEPQDSVMAYLAALQDHQSKIGKLVPLTEIYKRAIKAGIL